MALDPILSAFDSLAQRCPEAPLVFAEDRTVSVAQVARLAEDCAEVLAARPGGFLNAEVVGLAACNGPGFLAGLLACLRAGLPALLLDAKAPEPESHRIARALGARALLRCGACQAAEGDGFALVDCAPAEPFAPRTLPGIAVLKLTSGSTGAPRGIATPSAALIADDAALTAAMGIGAGDRLLAGVPWSHSYGLSSLVLPALVRGIPLVLPGESGVLAPLDAASAAAATVFFTVPAFLEAVLRLSHAPHWPASLRLVVTAGAPLKPETARRFRATFGQPVHVFYGASECGGICYDRTGGAGLRGTVGTPVGGVEIVLAHCDAMGRDSVGPAPATGSAAGARTKEPRGSQRSHDPEPGTEGRVTVRSASVAAGYVPEADPRLAEGRFVAGDFAAWQDGELKILGRLDDLINVKGKKVDPREVEAVLAQLPGVEEVAVVGVPMPERGALVRAVIACPSASLSAETVLDWCRGHLAAHKVPRSVILLPEMPRTARGKIDRPALVALAAPGTSGAPGAPSAPGTAAGTPPVP